MPEMPSHVCPQDLPDEVLMRIICCVHAPDEHWMRHLSSAARFATVCRRLRWVQCCHFVPEVASLP
jgi:hypothetical protein